MRIKLANIIGLLLRYATTIEDEIAQLEMHNIFIEIINKESSEKLRRSVAASLGEYLFYSATQIDEDPENKVW